MNDGVSVQFPTIIISRILILILALFVGGLNASSCIAQEDSFPTRTVTIVVPYSAGGGTDALARNIANVWSNHWKKPVVVVNRTGADGVIGSQYVKSLPADGYTVLFQVNQALFWPITLPQANIDVIRDFQLISKLQQNAMLFGVASSQPDQTFKDFIARCKIAEQPCSFGAATKHGEIMARQIIEKTGLTKAVVVPYKGTAPMMVDALGGHLSLGMPSLSVAMPHLRSGGFRGLAAGSRERIPELPDLPTLTEEGLDMSAVTWYGMMVRKGVPEVALNALVEAVQVAAKDPEVLKTIRSEGAVPVFASPLSFEKEAAEEVSTVTPLLKKYFVDANPSSEPLK
jgi:tripartite-type tricarboxylate transporter receptor subunit TctC